MMELIESLDDCLWRERRLFRWTCAWLAALVSLPVVFILQAVVFRKWMIARYYAGEDYAGLYYLEGWIRVLLLLMGLGCLIGFPAAMFSWIAAIRRRRFCDEVLSGGRNHSVRTR